METKHCVYVVMNTWLNTCQSLTEGSDICTCIKTFIST